MKLKRFLCKGKSSQNFLRSLDQVKVPSFQISCLTKLQKEGKPRLWYFEVSKCFVIGENLRKQALSKNFIAAHSQNRKSNSSLLNRESNSKINRSDGG